MCLLSTFALIYNVLKNLSLMNCENYYSKPFFSFLDFDPFSSNRSCAFFNFFHLNDLCFTWFFGAESGKVTCFTASVAGQWATSNLSYFNRLLSMTLCCLGPLWNSTLSLVSPKYYPSRLTQVVITFKELLWLLEECYREQKRKLFAFFSFWQHWGKQ